MVLWILLALIVPVSIIVGTSEYRREKKFWGASISKSDFVIPGMVSVIVGAVVTALYLLVVFFGTAFPGGKTSWEPYTKYSHSVVNLAALGNKIGTEGNGFYALFSGYSEEDQAQTISYVTQKPDGALNLNTVDASDSTIYEGASTATMDTITPRYSNPWLVPWDFEGYDTYTFRVPTGTVDRGFSMDVNK